METKTENTKWIDDACFIDFKKYPNSKMKITSIKLSNRATCNDCGSENCSIIQISEF